MISDQLKLLASYLAGEFDNREQALAQPMWYVHLRLWLRPVPLFVEDSLTLFAEQAPMVNLDRPYRQRLLRLRQTQELPVAIEVQHYQFKQRELVQGAGNERKLLESLTSQSVEWLSAPGCTLSVEQDFSVSGGCQFRAFSQSDQPCQFSDGRQIYHVSLGFEVSDRELRTYDKGINPQTGQAIWGALMGPYCFAKRQDFAAELPF